MGAENTHHPSSDDLPTPNKLCFPLNIPSDMTHVQCHTATFTFFPDQSIYVFTRILLIVNIGVIFGQGLLLYFQLFRLFLDALQVLELRFRCFSWWMISLARPGTVTLLTVLSMQLLLLLPCLLFYMMILIVHCHVCTLFLLHFLM